jgi:hypothetical protein
MDPILRQYPAPERVIEIDDHDLDRITTGQDLIAVQDILPYRIEKLLGLEISGLAETFKRRLKAPAIMLEVEIPRHRSVTDRMEGIIQDMTLADSGGDLIQIDIMDIGAG